MKTFALLSATVLATICPSSPAAARTPTNDAAAFRTFDLYANRTAAVNVIDHTNISGYPAYLSNLALLVTRTPGSTDSVAIFRSTPYDGMFFLVDNFQPQSYATYAVSPPQFATSLGTLAMGVSIYNSSGAFADFGKALMRATVTCVDGDTSVITLHVGYHMRDYFNSGPLSCNGNRPLYLARPTDALCGYIDETNNYFYDAQELRLPATKRSKRVASVRIDGVLLDHLCSGPFPTHIYGGSRLFGFSVWPNFVVKNASSQPVVRQSQFTNVNHGGYMFGGIPVGTRRLMNRTACQVASQAMDYTYTGFNCTPSQLNTYLQQHRGYEPDQVAIVTSVSGGGSSITFTATGDTKLIVGDRFLVEHETYTNPLATYQVTVQYQGEPYIAGQATRVTTHSATVPSVNDPGRVYWSMQPVVADGFASSPQLRTIDLHDSPQLAAQVESLLVLDTAVQLNVPNQFVVASGWTSSFRPDGSARGTYSIKDPFDDRNFTKLVEGKYRNRFTMARYIVPAGALEADGSVVAGSDPPGLGILASGARRIEITDPLGRHMLRDASTGEGVYEIPDAAIEDVSPEHDNGGDFDDPLTGYHVQIPTTVDGHYTVKAYVDNGLSMSVSGYDASGIFASGFAVDTTFGSIGLVYDVLYSGSGQSVTVTHTATLGVNSVPSSGPSLLRARQSPTTAPVEFLVYGVDAADDAIDVFDISGRRIVALEIPVGTGNQTVMWDWRRAGFRPGMYLARLRSRGSELTRFVILH